MRAAGTGRKKAGPAARAGLRLGKIALRARKIPQPERAKKGEPFAFAASNPVLFCTALI